MNHIGNKTLDTEIFIVNRCLVDIAMWTVIIIIIIDLQNL